MPELNLKWTASPQMEAHLNSLGVKFTVKRATLAAFDIPSSRKLQTRLTAHVDTDHAFNLAGDIERTKCVERLVCLPPMLGFKGFWICDGIHRQYGLSEYLHDMLPPDFEYEFYYIDTPDPKIRDLISRTCNCVGDKLSLSHEVRVVHIRYMITEYNMTIKDVAIHFHENPVTIQSELFVDAQRKELQEAGINVDGLSQGHIKEIAKIKMNDRLKQQLARVANQYRPTVKQVKQVVDDVLKAAKKESEDAAMGVIGDFKKGLLNSSAASAKTPAKGKRAPTRKKAFDLIGDLYRFVSLGEGDGKPYTTLKQIDITDPHDAHNFREQWKATKKIVDTMCHHG